MRNCPSSSEISDWLFGMLDSETCQAMEHHLARCVECRTRCDALLETHELLGEHETNVRNIATRFQDSPTDACGPELEAMLKRVIDPSASRNDLNLQATDLGADTVEAGPDTKAHPTQSTCTATPDPSSDQISTPNDPLHSFPGYVVDRPLGSGGFSTVFLAWDVRLKRQVAIKVLSPHIETEGRKRFQREASALAQIDDNHVIRVLHLGLDDDPAYLVLEYANGGTLHDWGPGGKGTEGEQDHFTTAKLVRDACQGLVACHAAGLVHRDIKPSNILVNRLSDSEVQGKIADFGLVQLQGEHTVTVTQTNAFIGTPAYTSPEQVANKAEVNELSDVYGMGAALYSALTGQPPFSGTPISILNQITSADPLPVRQLNESVPVDLQTICQKAMAKLPADRYPTAQALAADLTQFIQGAPINARPAGRWERTWKWCRRNKRTAALLLLSGSLLLGIATVSSISAIVVNSSYRQLEREQSATQAAELKARRDRSAAVSALSGLVTKLHNELSKRNSTIEQREQIIDSAIDGLRQITRSHDAGQRDEVLQLAETRLAELLALQGKPEEAHAAFQQAVRSATSVLAQAESAPSRLSASIALAQTRNAYAKFLENRLQLDQAAVQQREANQLLSTILPDYPNDQGLLICLLETRHRQMDIEWRANENETVIEIGEQTIAPTERLVELAPESALSHRLASALYQRLARSQMQLGNTEAAAEPNVLMRTHLTRAFELDPEDESLQQDYAFMLRMQAYNRLMQRDNEGSLELYDKARDIHIGLREIDPDDVERQMALANVYFLRNLVFLQRRDWAASAETLQNGIAIYRDIVRDDPEMSTARGLALQSFEMLMNGAAQSKQWNRILEIYEEAQELLPADRSQLGDAGFRIAYDGLIARHEAAHYWLGLEVQDPTPEGQSLALQSVVNLQAKAGSFGMLNDESLTILNRLGVDGPTQVDELLEHIQAIAIEQEYGIQLRDKCPAVIACLKAEQMFDRDATGKGTMDAIEAAAELVKQFWKKHSLWEPVAFYDPDFVWITSVPRGQELLLDPS